MKKVKVSEAEGLILNWLVGMAKGYELSLYGVDPSIRAGVPGLGVIAPWRPSYYWNQGGVLIEEECLDISCNPAGFWSSSAPLPNSHKEWWAMAYGPTPLVAAMRCFVITKLGEEVDVPDELIGI